MLEFIKRMSPGRSVFAGMKQLIQDAHATQTGADEVLFTQTTDQWNIALTRYAPQTTPRQHPVLLCHGMGANRYIFDMRADRSLARYLSARGFDTYCVELRGHGLSEHPSTATGKTFGWTFDDYLLQDLPAAFRFLHKRLSGRSIHYLGHSMGGLLLYATLAVDGGRYLRSGITVGSSLDYSGTGSDFESLSRLIGLTDYIPSLPLSYLSTLISPLSGRIDSPIDRFSAWPTNIEPELFRQCAALNFHDISSPVLRQLTSVFQTGGLRSADGNRRYTDGLHRASIPVLALAGDEDRQCPPDAARKTFAQLPGSEHQFRLMGPQNSDMDHYGHEDLLIGKRVKTEVFPVVCNWFVKHDGHPPHASN